MRWLCCSWLRRVAAVRKPPHQRLAPLRLLPPRPAPRRRWPRLRLKRRLQRRLCQLQRPHPPTGVQLCRMVVEVGESSLRPEFWYRSHWIAPEADVADADLACVDLNATNLFGSNLSGALLRSVYLVASDLSGADLSKANLSGLNGVAGWFARCNQF